MKHIKMEIYFLLVCILFQGCTTTQAGNKGEVKVFKASSTEAEWIRNGEPILFEEEEWFPQDGVETLLDSEVYIVGVYRGVQFFVDRVDVRPYERLYTKFSKNKFGYFKRVEHSP